MRRRRLSEAARARRAIREFDKAYGGPPGSGDLFLEGRVRRSEALKARARELVRKCEGMSFERARREARRFGLALKREGYGADEAEGAVRDAFGELRAKRKAEDEARREGEGNRPFGKEPRATAPDWGGREDEEGAVKPFGDDDDDDTDDDEEEDE